MGTFKTGGDVVDGSVSTGAFSATYSFAAYPLGSRRMESADEVVAAVHTDGSTSLSLQGDRTWVFVQATVALAPYECVVQNDVTTVNSRFLVRPNTTAGDNSLRIQGVAQHTIAITKYGWIVCEGQVAVKAASGITVGQFIDTHNAVGTVDDSSVAGTLIGIALTATGAPASGLISADIRLGQ